MSPLAPAGTQPFTILLNGARDSVPADTTVQDLLARLGLPKERVAVEIDGKIVRKSDYESSILTEGCRVEVVSFVGGG